MVKEFGHWREGEVQWNGPSYMGPGQMPEQASAPSSPEEPKLEAAPSVRASTGSFAADYELRAMDRAMAAAAVVPAAAPEHRPADFVIRPRAAAGAPTPEQMRHAWGTATQAEAQQFRRNQGD